MSTLAALIVAHVCALPSRADAIDRKGRVATPPMRLIAPVSWPQYGFIGTQKSSVQRWRRSRTTLRPRLGAPARADLVRQGYPGVSRRPAKIDLGLTLHHHKRWMPGKARQGIRAFRELGANGWGEW